MRELFQPMTIILLCLAVSYTDSHFMFGMLLGLVFVNTAHYTAMLFTKDVKADIHKIYSFIDMMQRKEKG